MKLKLVLIVFYGLLCHHQIAPMTSLVGLPRDEVEGPKRCVMERAYKMLGYICSNMNLKEIPQYLRSGTEVLDTSTNRIRELTKQSFAKYSDLKFLYLYDNMIQYIEKDTFVQLTSLEAIDLSTNGIRSIPTELFQLPLLRNLYIQENDLVLLDDDLKMVQKPIRAPLQYINIAQTKLNHIPDFGVLPDLWRLNVSFNNLEYATPQEFSAFCNLKTIDINDTRIPACTCQVIGMNFRKRGIQIINGMTCDTTAEELLYCADSSNSTLEAPSYAECQAIQRTVERSKKTKTTWISIAGGLFGFFILFMIVLYYFHRRNVKRSKEPKKSTKITHIHMTENGNREVLLTHQKT